MRPRAELARAVQESVSEWQRYALGGGLLFGWLGVCVWRLARLVTLEDSQVHAGEVAGIAIFMVTGYAAVAAGSFFFTVAVAKFRRARRRARRRR